MVDRIALLPLPVRAGDGLTITIDVPVHVQAAVTRHNRIDQPNGQPGDVAVVAAIGNCETVRSVTHQRHILRRAQTQQAATDVVRDKQGAVAVTRDTE